LDAEDFNRDAIKIEGVHKRLDPSAMTTFTALLDIMSVRELSYVHLKLIDPSGSQPAFDPVGPPNGLAEGRHWSIHDHRMLRTRE
jgi:hypothetical protein